MEEIMSLFTGSLRNEIFQKTDNRWSMLQEIRIRMNQPVEIIFDSHTERLTDLYANKQDITYLINQISQFSLYRLEEELKKGYVTIRGGHRIGLAGKVNTTNGNVKAIKDITFFNIRIAKEKIGAALPYMKELFDKDYCSTLIIGPPQTGKTTLLRDISRLIGSGWKHASPVKVGIVDERSEISGCLDGVPQHDVGARTDVLDACPKAEGVMMLIRSMSPDVIVVDEIGSEEDVFAIQEALHAGVKLMCSAHGSSLDDIKKRISFTPLFKSNMFDRFIILRKSDKPGTVFQILDGKGNNLMKKRNENNEMVRSSSIINSNHLDRV
ncbi:stage III sporulation protein AA [Paraliobacillus sp. JSM ZJ581]|uniref:stage III sporulation protein AA n=1 Tax=Paraliobacillus sp. JSM ZJ581 TaxID=3342118 RepID=UPI0035A955D7